MTNGTLKRFSVQRLVSGDGRNRTHQPRLDGSPVLKGMDLDPAPFRVAQRDAFLQVKNGESSSPAQPDSSIRAQFGPTVAPNDDSAGHK